MISGRSGFPDPIVYRQMVNGGRLTDGEPGGGVYTETCSADLFGRVSFERHRLPNADGSFPIRYPALTVPTTATAGILQIEV